MTMHDQRQYLADHVDPQNQKAGYWLHISHLWRNIVVNPMIKKIDSSQQGDDAARKMRRRELSCLLESEVLIIALHIYQGGWDRSFSIRQLSGLIAEDSTSLSQDKARKRMHRIVSAMKTYDLIAVNKTRRGETVHYEIKGTEQLKDLLDGLMDEFPHAPPCLQNQATDGADTR